MAHSYNRAGKSTREMADKRYQLRVWWVLITASIVLVICAVVANSKSLGLGGAGVIGLVLLARIIMNYMDRRASKLIREERRAIRGAKAEETIGSILEGLGEDYLVIHDVVSPYGNIDHIVIGKESGVFLIETKAHGGRVTVSNGRLLVNGHDPEKDFIAQALKNALWLRGKIQSEIKEEVWVTPLLVFTNAFVERSRPLKGVTILNKKYLLEALQKPAAKPQATLIWEKREIIRDMLYSSGGQDSKG